VASSIFWKCSQKCKHEQIWILVVHNVIIYIECGQNNYISDLTQLQYELLLVTFSLNNLWTNHLLLIEICVVGGIAAAVTTPLDVAKTRIMLAEKNIHSQADCRRLHTYAMLISIYREQGIQGYVFIPNKFFSLTGKQ